MRQKIPLKLLLVENSASGRCNIKMRLISEGLLDSSRCSVCNTPSVWNNKPLSLVLDHINGINNDNRLENLRLLCPNCNSQTDTFAGKNIKKKRPRKSYLCKCGTKIGCRSKTCKRCREYASKIDLDKVVELKGKLTKTELASMFNVTEAAIRKALKKMSREVD